MTEKKITQEELVELFGEMMPMEAAQILLEPDDNDTPETLRAKLKKIAAS